MKTLLIALMLTLFATFAQADGGYKCRIVTANDVTDKGKLSVNEYNGLHKSYIGKDFVVDRASGRIIGHISSYTEFGKTEVIDYGSTEQAYKAITTSTLLKPIVGKNITFLQIEEFRKSKEKPFMFTDGSIILTGTCISY